jgi:hypothetical protein
MSEHQEDVMSAGEWTVDSIMAVLRRQATGLKAIRDLMLKDPNSKPPDHSAQLVEALLQLKAIIAYAEDIAHELEDIESENKIAKEKPTIDEEILALGKSLHPNLSGRLTRRKRPGMTSSEIDKEFRYERMLIMRDNYEMHEYKDDSLPLLKTNLKRRLKSRKP